jgi:uroporphyrinogen decarboxylase
MAIEPSAFGNRIHFHADRTPDQSASLVRLEDVDGMAPVNPLTDGLMPLALHRYRSLKPRILDAGYIIPMVAARGPLCQAAFLRGVTNVMTDMIDQPDAVKRLLALTTRAAIDWLTADRYAGSRLSPIRYRSIPCAALRPSRMAHTTSDCPRRMSPAEKTPGTEVM